MSDHTAPPTDRAPDDPAGGGSVPRGAEDTITAVSTPPGRGGIGVVRLSGSRAGDIALRMFRPAGGAPEPEPGRAVFGQILAPGENAVDHGYLVLFRPPRSFTGEETAEIWSHGSPAVLRWIVEQAVALGARPATPGEFTLRAFLNGRIDVTQAEAIRDLIEARTLYQAKVAYEQVGGRISREVDRLKRRLTDMVARLEAVIEFSEEAEAERFAPEGGVRTGLGALRAEIERLAGTYERGRRVRDGAVLALVGLPNVGKSSLFNRLLEEDRAIVAAEAGTTRDLLEETLELEGIPAVLCDTAGLIDLTHTVTATVDAEAVRRSRSAQERADLLLLVLDWSRPLREEERRLLEETSDRRRIVVLNKIDLPCGAGMDAVLSLRKRHGVAEVSARSGEGVADLRRRLAAGVGQGGEHEEAFLTNVRHRDLLLRAAVSLQEAERALAGGAGEEYYLLDLKDALKGLGEITGEVGIERIYDAIFSTFCIGK
jgi:tRNA modification GTPase